MIILSTIALPANPAFADSFRDDQWYLKSLDVAQAQVLSKGSGIKVAVVDTGIDRHPDLRRNLLPGINFASGQDKDGQLDQDGHGTSMASIIAAHGKTSRDGVLGIAPDSKILPVKITNDGNSMPAERMASGVEWAAQQGASVISISAETGPAFDLVNSVNDAISKDIIVVSGVGNTSKQAIMAYPAAINGVLVVGSVDRKGRHAEFSIKNPKVQICAPGVSITSARPGGRYVDMDGTSASTAIVSGAAALIQSKFPSLSAENVVNRLTATADDTGPPGRDSECGFGRLNLIKALTADVPLVAGGGSVAPSGSAPSASGPSANGPEYFTASAAPRAQREPAGGNGVLLLGGLAGVVAAVGVLVALVVRRRRRG